jgi:hypothetical protein
MWDRLPEQFRSGNLNRVVLVGGVRVGKSRAIQAILRKEDAETVFDLDNNWDQLDAASQEQLDRVTWEQMQRASQMSLDTRFTVTRWSAIPSNAWRVLGDIAQPAPLLHEARGRRSFAMLLGALPRAFVQEFGSEMVADFVTRARENRGYGLWVLREVVGVIIAAVCLRLAERSPMKRLVAVGASALGVDDFVPTGHCCGNEPCRCAALEDQ